MTRRRFASDSSYGSDMSPLPLKVNGDSLPSAPRRTGSGSMLSTTSSVRFSPKEVTTTSNSHKTDDSNCVLGVKSEQQQQLTYDRVPSLPLREYSLHKKYFVCGGVQNGSLRGFS